MILSYLKKAYPLNNSLKRNLLIGTIVGLFIFGINMYSYDDEVMLHFRMSYTKMAAIFGFITFISVIVVLYILPQFVFSNKIKENWTVLKEIGLIIFLHIIIIISNFIFFMLIVKEDTILLTSSFIFWSIFSTFLLGFFPSMFILWIDYTLRLKKALLKVLTYNNQLEQNIKESTFLQEESIIRLQSNKLNDSIVLDVNDLIFIKSDGNYIEIFTSDNGKIVKTLYRYSLQLIEEQLKQYPFILRVHRSFIINIYKVNKASGNARNYQLYFKGIEENVPVSRTKFEIFINEFNSIMSSNHK